MSNSRNILNGIEIPETEYPAVGAVSDIGASFICTGTLIAPQWVLTAAHCVQDKTDLTFITGGIAETPARQIYNILKVEIYPYYRGADNLGYNNSHDIALIQLDRDSPITPLVINPNAPHVGNPLTLVGYGAGGDGATGNDGIVGIKRKGTTTVETVSSHLLSWAFQIGESNTTLGDSGGPAIINENIAGISSTGAIPDIYGTITYHTRIDSYKNWIAAITAPTQITSTGTQAPLDSATVQNNDRIEIRANYHTEVHNAIIIKR